MKVRELFPLDADEMSERYDNSPWSWVHFEQSIYHFADKFCEDYSGGYWRYYPIECDAKKELGMVLKAPMLALDEPEGKFHIRHNYVDQVVNESTFAACVTSYALTYAAEKMVGQGNASRRMYDYLEDFNAAIMRHAVEDVDTKVFWKMTN